MTKRI